MTQPRGRTHVSKLIGETRGGFYLPEGATVGQAMWTNDWSMCRMLFRRCLFNRSNRAQGTSHGSCIQYSARTAQCEEVCGRH